MQAIEKDGYTLKKVIKGNNCTIRVFSPVLTDEERARRMTAIHKAAAGLLSNSKVVAI